PESFFESGHIYGWVILFALILFGFIFVFYFYKEAIRPIVVSKDAELESRTRDEDERNQPHVADFYLKKRCSHYLGITKENKKKIPDATK
ncbi:hypothetical protein PFISCL1PPCAC_13566, partial [Pristionchus fissidentatus]